jgi:glycosyltransferase involved in cell wall biosynthesis
MKISACVICKNEEANIRHWLAAVKPLADELVVVDTGSSDRTVELAQEGGAAVYDFPWINDFSAAKNYALDQATGDWIIFLDTDESFRPEDVPHIRPFLKKIHHNRKIAGLISPLVNIDVDHHNRVLTTGYQMRVFRREKNLRYRGCVHEMIKNLAPKGHDREFRMTGFTVIHTGYSAHIMKQKIRRDLELLLAEEKRTGGVAVDHFTYLVDCYMDLKEYDKALHFAKLAVEHDKESTLAGQSKKVHWQLLGAMTAAGASTTEIDAALDRFQTEHPDWTELYWRRAVLRYDEQDYAQAEELLIKTLALCQQSDDHPEELMGTVMEGAMPQVHHYYAVVLAKHGKWRQAKQQWEIALQRYPFYEAAFYNWYLLLLRQGRTVDERLHSLRKFYDLKRDQVFLLAQLQRFVLDEVYRRIAGPTAEGTYGQLALGNHQVAVELAGKELQQIHRAIRQAVKLGSPAELTQWQIILPERQG